MEIIDQVKIAKEAEDAAKLAACLVHRASELASARPAVMFSAFRICLVQFVESVYGKKKAQALAEAISRITNISDTFPRA